VASMGGVIAVTSVPNEGAEFVVVLPEVANTSAAKQATTV
jgi:signal transduction histidine kinase